MAGESGARRAPMLGKAPSLEPAWVMPSLGLLGLGPTGKNQTGPENRQVVTISPGRSKDRSYVRILCCLWSCVGRSYFIASLIIVPENSLVGSC